MALFNPVVQVRSWQCDSELARHSVINAYCMSLFLFLVEVLIGNVFLFLCSLAKNQKKSCFFFRAIRQLIFFFI